MMSDQAELNAAGTQPEVGMGAASKRSQSDNAFGFRAPDSRLGRPNGMDVSRLEPESAPVSLKEVAKTPANFDI